MLPTPRDSARLAEVAGPPFFALEQLIAEHREIETILEALVGWGNQVAGGQDDERREAARFVHVMRSFVADWHHAREDGILFQMLDRAAPADERGAVAVMMHEHMQLDRLVAELGLLAAAGTTWTPAERASVAETTSAYAGLVRRHIAKEENVVYPMAAALLVSAAKSEVDLRFEAFACTEGDESLAMLRTLSASLVAAHPPHTD